MALDWLPLDTWVSDQFWPLSSLAQRLHKQCCHKQGCHRAQWQRQIPRGTPVAEWQSGCPMIKLTQFWSEWHPSGTMALAWLPFDMFYICVMNAAELHYFWHKGVLLP